MTPFSSSPAVRLHIETVAHGGDGVARHQGRTVFVPFAAPGDEVDARLAPERGGVIRGRLLQVVEPGPDRITPPCPVAGSCGGCHWQHLAPSAQIEAKQRNVVDVLTRIGGFENPPVLPLVPSPRTLRYRRRLRVRPVKGGWGFNQRASHSTIRAASCLLAEVAVDDLVTRVAEQLREVGGFGAIEDFAVDTLENGDGSLHLRLAQPPTPRVQKRATRLLAAVEGLRGIVLSGGDHPPTGTTLVGNPVLVDSGHHGLRVRPDLFAQANRLGARLLADAVAETVEPGSSVLELYSGAGTLTLAYEERAGDIVATEGEGASLDLLRATLGARKRKAQLIGGPAKQVVHGLAEDGAMFDHVVLDPPRSGARDVLEPLVRIQPKRISYVSCDPATFARDARQLSRSGYALSHVTPFDLFPQTFHAEVVGVFERE